MSFQHQQQWGIRSLTNFILLVVVGWEVELKLMPYRASALTFIDCRVLAKEHRNDMRNISFFYIANREVNSGDQLKRCTLSLFFSATNDEHIVRFSTPKYHWIRYLNDSYNERSGNPLSRHIHFFVMRILWPPNEIEQHLVCIAWAEFAFIGQVVP